MCAAGLLAGALSACSNSTFEADKYLELNQRYNVSIERDKLGVPHVIGLRDVDTAFGFAWAQAEDNWPIMQETLAINRGVRGRTAGPDGAVTDFLIRWLRIWQTLDERYASDLKPETRDFVEAFADGLNFYAANHPETSNFDLFPITGKDLSLIHI